MIDFKLERHGTVALLHPQTTAAETWLNENVVAEGWQWLGRALAVEPRLMPNITQALAADGLTVECV